ncbi:MAG TPA: hypothetical protein VEK57_25430 [Thermoanaerobaculia bacterium]|nr:hypothetical protein [Thermoanaerobaculia bacterium]
MAARVTLSIYSGRTDPSWPLSDEQIEELAERLRSAERLATLPTAQLGENLGYRGFLVESDDARLPARLAVYRNVAVAHRDGDVTAFRVPDLERFLVNTGRHAISDPTLSYLEQELG